MRFSHCPSGKRHCAIERKGGMRCRHLLPFCFLPGFPPDIEYPLGQTGQLFHWVCHKVDILLYEGTFPHQLQGKILFLSLENDRINAKFFRCVVSFWIRSYCYCTSNVKNESLYLKIIFGHWCGPIEKCVLCCIPSCTRCSSGGTVVSYLAGETPFTLSCSEMTLSIEQLRPCF